MIKMNKIKSQLIETTHFGNGWGLYVDIENYHYKVDEYSNKIIKRNAIYDNEYGNKYDYDFLENILDDWFEKEIINISEKTILNFK